MRRHISSTGGLVTRRRYTASATDMAGAAHNPSSLKRKPSKVVMAPKRPDLEGDWAAGLEPVTPGFGGLLTQN
jgi:hypothetical protein